MNATALSPIAKRFAWKEFRTLRGFWLAAFVLGALVQWFMLATNYRPPTMGWPTTLFIVALVAAALYAVGVAATTFSMEHEEGTYDFLTGLPTRWLPLFAGKMLYALTSAVALAAALGIVGCLMTGGELPSLDGAAFALGAFGFVIVEALVWGTLFSLLLRQPLLAALLAIGAVSMSLSWLTSTFVEGNLSSLNASSYLAVLPQRAALAICVFLVDVVLARRWFVMDRPRRRDSTGAMDADGLGSSRARAWARLRSRVRPAEIRHFGLRMIGRLLWHSWRQSWRWILGMPAVGLLFCFIVYLVSYGSHQRWLDAEDQIGLGPFILSIAITGLYASGVFTADQRGHAYRFFASHAAWPRSVWLSRLVVWLLPIAVLLTIVLFFGLTAANQSQQYLLRTIVSMFRDSVWHNGRFLYGNSLQAGLILQSFTLALWGVALGFALGQACSLFFRRALVAGLAVGVTTIPLIGLTILLWIWELSPASFLLPIIVGLFVATWLRVPDWLVERNTLTAWAKVSLAIALPLIYVAWLLPASRQLPANANGQMVGRIVSSLGVPWNGTWQKRPATPEIEAIVAGWVDKNAAANAPSEQATADRLVRLAESIAGSWKWDLQNDWLPGTYREPDDYQPPSTFQERLEGNHEIVTEAARLARKEYRFPQVWENNPSNADPIRMRLWKLVRLFKDAARDATQQEQLDEALDYLLAALTLQKRLSEGQYNFDDALLHPQLIEWAKAEGQTSARIQAAIVAIGAIDPEISDDDARERFAANGLASMASWSPPPFLMTNYLALRDIISGKEPSRLITQDATWRDFAVIHLNGFSFERKRALAILADLLADHAAQWYRALHLTNQARLQRQSRITEAPSREQAFADTAGELRRLVFLAQESRDVVVTRQFENPPYSWMQTSLLLAREFELSLGRTSWLQSYVETQIHAWGIRQQLALVAYRLDHGKYPDSLDALVPDYLPFVPIDPYSGRPFEYRPQGLDHELNGIPPGTPLLWSVGAGDAQLRLTTVTGSKTNQLDPSEEPVDIRRDVYELHPRERTIYYFGARVFRLPHVTVAGIGNTGN